MKVAFLRLPESERRIYIERAAARRSVSAVFIEKDFWCLGCSRCFSAASSPGTWSSRSSGSVAQNVFSGRNGAPDALSLPENEPMSFASRAPARSEKTWKSGGWFGHIPPRRTVIGV